MSDCDECNSDEYDGYEDIDDSIINFVDSPSERPCGVLKVAPQCPIDIPEGMEIEAYRFSLPLEAIKWTKEKKFELAIKYNKKFNVHKYIWAYESKEKHDVENNPHLHMFCILKKPARSTKSDYITKDLNNYIRKDSMGRLMYKPEKKVKDLNAYLAYIIKESDYITNMTKKEIEYIENLKDEIQEDMKKCVRHKLLDKIKLINDKNPTENVWDMNTLCDIIINIYIFDWDMEPPLHKIKGQALYVGRKLKVPLAMTEKIMFWQ